MSFSRQTGTNLSFGIPGLLPDRYGGVQYWKLNEYVWCGRAKSKAWEKPAALFLGRDNNQEKCLSFVSCYHAWLLKWLLKLGEKVAPSEDIYLSALSRGYEVEEATDDQHVQP